MSKPPPLLSAFNVSSYEISRRSNLIGAPIPRGTVFRFTGGGTAPAQPLDSGEVRLTYATAKFGDLGRQNIKHEMARINREIESDVYRDKKDKDKAIAASKTDLIVAKNPIKAHYFGRKNS